MSGFRLRDVREFRMISESKTAKNNESPKKKTKSSKKKVGTAFFCKHAPSKKKRYRYENQGFCKKEIVIGIFQLIGNFVQGLNRGKVSLAGCLGSQVRSILGQPFQLPQHPPLTTT